MDKKSKINTAILTGVSLFIFFSIVSCTKEGTGGNGIITGHVKHHEKNIPNAMVYIKYGAKELPGTNTSDYDASTVTSTSDGHYEFEELMKGDYYLYATGYDSSISEIVKGGIPVKIKKKAETVEVDVPVTE